MRGANQEEQHMLLVENRLLDISSTRRKLRETADEIEREEGEEHLVRFLRRADKELETTYNDLLRDTHFYVSEEDLAKAGSGRREREQQADELKARKASPKIEVPEPAEELRLFEGEEAAKHGSK